MKIESLGKRYMKLEERPMLVRSILPISRPSHSELWALKDIDIAISRGETVGIIGRNGAGKTTLLRLLAGVTRPTEGRLEVNGLIAPLISVGVGFHKEMTGRENVFVNGTLLGLERSEIEARFDEIVSFAELEEFIDTPVKFYSSGMFLRLGFSVAVHVSPDVLLVDEILAVGDIGFQLKCYERMREIQSRGTTILIVSHSMDAIRLLCPRAILLRDGRVEFDGASGEAIARQHELLTSHPAEELADTFAPVRIIERELLGPDGPTNHPERGHPVTYRATLRFDRPVAGPQLLFQVLTRQGVVAYAIRTVAGEWRRFDAGETTEVEVPFEPRLAGGSYRLMLHVTDSSGYERLFEDHEGLHMYMAPPPGTAGIADLAAMVRVDGELLSRYPELMLDAGDPGARASPSLTPPPFEASGERPSSPH